MAPGDEARFQERDLATPPSSAKPDPGMRGAEARGFRVTPSDREIGILGERPLDADAAQEIERIAEDHSGTAGPR